MLRRFYLWVSCVARVDFAYVWNPNERPYLQKGNGPKNYCTEHTNVPLITQSTSSPPSSSANHGDDSNDGEPVEVQPDLDDAGEIPKQA